MKKLSILFAAASALILAASCNKQMAAPEAEKQTIKLTVRLEEPQTKATYADPGDGTLKVAWEAEESITLIGVDGSLPVLFHNLIGSGEPGAKEMVFEADMLLLANEDLTYFLVYPPLSFDDLGGDTSNFSSADETLNYDYDKNEFTYCPKIDFMNMTDPSGVKVNDLMFGIVEDLADLSPVTLQHEIAVLKFVLTLPEALRGEKVASCSIFPKSSYYGTAEDYPMFFGANFDFSNFSWIPDNGRMGASPININNVLTIPEDGKLVYYVPFTGGTMKADLYGFQILVVNNGRLAQRCSPWITVSEDIPITKGKMIIL